MKKIYEYQMTIAEWIGLAVMLSAPYLAIGIIWSIGHLDSVGGEPGVNVVLWFFKSTVTWPWLMFSSVLCAT
jgi:hypothetical protein